MFSSPLFSSKTKRDWVIKKSLGIFRIEFFCSDPNGASSFSSDLPCRFEPTKPEAPERHYVFTLEPHMSDDYFEGRPQKYIELSGTSREELSCK